MTKYVSFRLEKSDLNKVVNQYRHDARIHSPKYVRQDKSHLNEQYYVSDDFKRILDACKSPKKAFDEYNELQRVRVKEKTGRSAQASAEFFNQGIMTFSPEMAADYESDPLLFQQSSEKFIRSLEAQFGFRVITATLHLDETTPHIHLIFDNISDEGKGIRRKVNPKALTAIQNTMGACYASMGYERGESVSKTHRKHLSVSSYKKVQEAIDLLKDEISDLKDKATLSKDFLEKLSTGDRRAEQLLKLIESGKTLQDLSEGARANVESFIDEMKTKPKTPSP